MEIRKVHFNKTSFVLTIPKSFAQQLRLNNGDLVRIDLLYEDTLTVKPIKDLLASQSSANVKEGKS